MPETKELTNEEKLLAIKGWHDYGSVLDKKDVDWLIEQTKLAEELNRLVSTHAPEGRNYTNAQYVKLLLESKRFREALEFYADYDKWVAINQGSPWQPDYRMDIQDDSGDKARQALEVE